MQFTQAIYSDALKSFARCLKLDDRFKFAYYGQAKIYFELNRPELVLQDFERATELEIFTDNKYHLNDQHDYDARGLARY